MADTTTVLAPVRGWFTIDWLWMRSSRIYMKITKYRVPSRCIWKALTAHWNKLLPPLPSTNVTNYYF